MTKQNILKESWKEYKSWFNKETFFALVGVSILLIILTFFFVGLYMIYMYIHLIILRMFLVSVWILFSLFVFILFFNFLDKL